MSSNKSIRQSEEEFKRLRERFQQKPTIMGQQQDLLLHFNTDDHFKITYNLSAAMRQMEITVLMDIMNRCRQELEKRGLKANS